MARMYPDERRPTLGAPGIFNRDISATSAPISVARTESGGSACPRSVSAGGSGLGRPPVRSTTGYIVRSGRLVTASNEDRMRDRRDARVRRVGGGVVAASGGQHLASRVP